ncbi:MAG TPA: DUF697 domain-containing protein [Gemmataceae bacterium]|nr:DUF697 domain-containing protein [Gemmataceae bacterium]
MFDTVKNLLSSRDRDAEFQNHWEILRKKSPVPVFWLLGKTQSGKTSIIRFLTGAEDAEIGEGFRPCTRFSRQYQFPAAEAPLLTFLDTRGLDEPGYDPTVDLAQFNHQAHVIVVTVKVLDQAQENLLKQLTVIRQAQTARPVVLALTCLHEAYPQQQHIQPYPFEIGIESREAPEDLRRSLLEQKRRFESLVDVVVPIDLTRPEEGFSDANYGGARLKQVLLEVLPKAYRQTLMTLDEVPRDLADRLSRRALPYIIGYSSLAATTGAIPIPWVDLLVLPGIQSRMIFHLAKLYGQPLSGTRFLEMTGTLGLGMVMRQAVREVAKLIPYIGSVAGAALAGASTYALGKAFCFYFKAVHQGHVPSPEEIRHYYRDQLHQAERFWKPL